MILIMNHILIAIAIISIQFLPRYCTAFFQNSPRIEPCSRKNARMSKMHRIIDRPIPIIVSARRSYFVRTTTSVSASSNTETMAEKVGTHKQQLSSLSLKSSDGERNVGGHEYGPGDLIRGCVVVSADYLGATVALKDGSTVGHIRTHELSSNLAALLPNPSSADDLALVGVAANTESRIKSGDSTSNSSNRRSTSSSSSSILVGRELDVVRVMGGKDKKSGLLRLSCHNTSPGIASASAAAAKTTGSAGIPGSGARGEGAKWTERKQLGGSSPLLPFTSTSTSSSSTRSGSSAHKDRSTSSATATATASATSQFSGAPVMGSTVLSLLRRANEDALALLRRDALELNHTFRHCAVINATARGVWVNISGTSSYVEGFIHKSEVGVFSDFIIERKFELPVPQTRNSRTHRRLPLHNRNQYQQQRGEPQNTIDSTILQYFDLQQQQQQYIDVEYKGTQLLKVITPPTKTDIIVDEEKSGVVSRGSSRGRTSSGNKHPVKLSSSRTTSRLLSRPPVEHILVKVPIFSRKSALLRGIGSSASRKSTGGTVTRNSNNSSNNSSSSSSNNDRYNSFTAATIAASWVEGKERLYSVDAFLWSPSSSSSSGSSAALPFSIGAIYQCRIVGAHSGYYRVKASPTVLADEGHSTTSTTTNDDSSSLSDSSSTFYFLGELRKSSLQRLYRTDYVALSKLNMNNWKNRTTGATAAATATTTTTAALKTVPLKAGICLDAAVAIVPMGRVSYPLARALLKERLQMNLPGASGHDAADGDNSDNVKRVLLLPVASTARSRLQQSRLKRIRSNRYAGDVYKVLSARKATLRTTAGLRSGASSGSGRLGAAGDDSEESANSTRTRSSRSRETELLSEGVILPLRFVGADSLGKLLFAEVDNKW